MALRAGWVPCVGLQPPKPSLQFIEEAASVSLECEGLLSGGKAHSSETVSVNDSAPKSKPAMKLVMNPKGVQDHRTVEQHYEQLLQESTTSSSSFPAHFGPSVHIPPSPEIAKDIINDMQSPTGKGAALFAKRKKRMDKFIVDETNVQKTSAYQHSVVNSSMEQSFSSFSSNSSSSSSVQQQQQPVAAAATPGLTAPPGSKKRLQQERDLEQQKIMMSSSSSYSSTSIIGQSGPAWLEGPKPVPVTAPLPTAGGGASLPNPPSLFARPAANGPATLPEISTILTTSNPTKSFKAGGINITPVLKLNPHFSSKPQPAKSPRSSSVGHKVPEKRLSTIPKAAQYPFPSYLSLASQQGGCVRSSSTSSIPRLAASSASNSYDDFDLKPGSPPVVCRPSQSQERSSLENDSAADQVQNNIYKDVKLRKIQSSSTSSSSNRESKPLAPGLVYTAEVKLEQPPKSSIIMQSAGPAAPAFKVAAAPAFKPAPGASPAFVPKASPSPASVSTIPENPASGSPAFIPAATGSPAFIPAATGSPAFIPAATGSPAFNPAATGSPAFNPAATGSPAFNPTAIGSPAFNPAAIGSQAQTNSTQFTPRATMNAGSGGQMSLADKRRSVNFNLAASGWGTYNEYYRPTSFAT
ncbi:cell wall adhesin EAP1 [Hyalella azteca]|uniref:Cell wall adhesin EAP1 n=1 Tax=Hyalella azteca TaxID=294128 RepID=A0A979FLX9_HYAAZ|nr:cell wall adhesin EAP1 [Hyalella azteca]